MKPDFDALRAERNRKWGEFAAKLRADGYEVSNANPHGDACYCDCAAGGPCEHDWTGPEWTSEDGYASSVKCVRCGAVCMHHDMRVMP